MSYAQHAGLANPKCQLYMLFYYIGPASVEFKLRCRGRRGKKGRIRDAKCGNNTESGNHQYSNGQYNTGTSYGATNNNQYDINGVHDEYEEIIDDERSWPKRHLLLKASAIALFDIFAQSMTYTGE